MKVAAVTRLYPPSARVGAWIATHSFLAHLVACGHHVTVHRTMARQEADYVIDGVEVRGSTGLEQSAAEADVIIAHLGDARPGGELAERHGVPLVRLAHGHVDHHAERLAGSALVVCNSNATRTALHDWEGPLVVCHPVTVPDEHRTVPGDRVSLVNLSEEKGGRVFAMMAASLPALPFLGVVGAYGRQHIRRTPNVEIVSTTVSMREDVWSRTRVLVMPSERETWGMVAVEAMVSGIPVVASPTPGLRECLGPAGIWVDRSDLAGWRFELTRLDDPDEWAAASAAATERAGDITAGNAESLERFRSAIEGVA